MQILRRKPKELLCKNASESKVLWGIKVIFNIYQHLGKMWLGLNCTYLLFMLHLRTVGCCIRAHESALLGHKCGYRLTIHSMLTSSHQLALDPLIHTSHTLHLGTTAEEDISGNILKLSKHIFI